MTDYEQAYRDLRAGVEALILNSDRRGWHVRGNCAVLANDLRALLASSAPAAASDAVEGPTELARNSAPQPEGDESPSPTRTQAISALAYAEGWLSNEHPDAARYLRGAMDEIADQMVDDDCARPDTPLTTDAEPFNPPPCASCGRYNGFHVHGCSASHPTPPTTDAEEALS